MSRFYLSSKTEADYLKKIEIWWLGKSGYLDSNWGKNGVIEWTNGFDGSKSSIGIRSDLQSGNYIELTYTQTEADSSKKDFYYKIQLTSTNCHFGGKRWWFICPLVVNGVFCGRRVGVLYKNGDYFGCSRCQNLTYSSQNKSRDASFSPLFVTLETMQKAEKLEANIKRRYYAGKPTRKQQRLNKLYQKMIKIAALIDRGRGVN